jgi:hypothetical protein
VFIFRIKVRLHPSGYRKSLLTKRCEVLILDGIIVSGMKEKP